MATTPQQRAQALGSAGDQQTAQRELSGRRAASRQRRQADVEAIQDRLAGADLSGRGSTVATDPFERKRQQQVAAKGAAIAAAFGSAAPGHQSLAELMKASSSADRVHALVKVMESFDTERVALKKGLKKARKKARAGCSSAVAMKAGFERYHKLGGRATFEMWVGRAGS